jgi:hypothetical protein
MNLLLLSFTLVELTKAENTIKDIKVELTESENTIKDIKFWSSTH